MRNLFFCSFLLLASCSKDDLVPAPDPVTNPQVVQKIITYPDATTPTVKIGNQIWTTQNLDVSVYRDGTKIQPGNTLHVSFNVGMVTWPNNDSTKYSVFGRMYNYYAVSNPKNLAPVGYHVPTLAEWKTLFDYLEPNAKITPGVFGGSGKSYTSVTNKLKQAGYTYWKKAELMSDDFSELVRTTATNSTRFTALPAGSNYRKIVQTFTTTTLQIANPEISKWAYFLTADGYVIMMCYCAGNIDMIQVENSKNYLDKGDRFFSVRLIKD